jgi:hypothetical protein
MEQYLSVSGTYPCDYLPPVCTNQQLHFTTRIFRVTFQCHCITNYPFLRRYTDDKR